MIDNLNSVLTQMIVGSATQSDLAKRYGVSEAKLSRALNGQPAGVKLIEAIHTDDPSMDTLFTGESHTPSRTLSINGDLSDIKRAADNFIIAARHQHGLAHVRAMRDGICLYMKLAVDESGLYEDGRLFVDANILQQMIEYLRELPKNVPAAYREDLQLGVSQNIASVQFLIDKASAGTEALQVNSPSIRLYLDVYSACENLTPSKNEVKQTYRRTIKLYSGMNLIEALIEAKLENQAKTVYDRLVEYFGTSKRRNIERRLLNNVWLHNQSAVKEIIEGVDA